MPALSAKRLSQWFSSLAAGAGMIVSTSNTALAQDTAQPDPLPPPTPAQEGAIRAKLSSMFNNSEVTSTGWAMPLATLNSSGTTTLRTEVGYGDATPGLYVNHKFAEGLGQADLGFMNFSLNVFPLGDTLSFNSKGNLYSNGEQTGDQLGLRYKNTLDLGPSETLEYAGFAGVSLGGQPSAGANATYHKDLGNWHLLAGGGISLLGERDVVALNGIGAATRSFTFDHLPDGKLTLGFELKDEFGKGGISRALAFGEYQTHLVKDDGPGFIRHLSALFTAYGGTESYGGKAGLLYNPGRLGAGKKDFGVTVGPSVGWDSKQGGPQFNLELRAGF